MDEIRQSWEIVFVLTRRLRNSKAISPYKIFTVVAVALLTISSFSILQSKASSESWGSVVNPVTLFEIPEEMKVTFQVCSTDMSLSSYKVDFQLGETVFLGLEAKMYQGGYHHKITNNTLFIVTDSTGTIVWSKSMGEFGGEGLFEITSAIVRWTPEKAGDYFAGVVFQETDYPSDFTNVIPFRVFNPCPFTGQVTELENNTKPISNATIEALQDDEIKAQATTDNEGHFTMQLEKAGIYDIRVTASGYITTVFKKVTTTLENTSLLFSLAPVSLSSTFSITWTKAFENNCLAAVDLDGNIVTAEGIETVIVSKFDSDGNVLWNISRCFSGQLGPIASIAVDSSKNIYLLLTVAQDSNHDFCTVKLDPSGNEMWTTTFDSGENDFGRGLTVGPQDRVLVFGNIYGSVHAEGALAIINYNSEGNLDSSKILTGPFELGELLIDGENNVIIAGTTYRNATDRDYYIAKLATNDTLVWEQTFTTYGKKPEYCKSVSLDSNGNIVVIGDQFLIKLDPNGNKMWSRYFTGKDLVVDANDNIIAIDGSVVEIFNPSGHFLGQMSLDDDLSSIVFDAKGNLVVAGAHSMTKLSYSVLHSPVQNDSVEKEAVTNQPSLEISDPKLSFAVIIPLLMIAALLLERVLKKRAN